MQKSKLAEIDKVVSNLLLYINPDIVLPSYTSELVKGKFFNLKMVKKYWHILSSIDWFVKKISKYESFFIYFYPNHEKISESDALEHHIHAYLEDMKTLENKLIFFINSLKNDLKKIAINKHEIISSFEIIEGKIFKAFTTPSELRNKHRHFGSRFLDHNVADAQNASFFLDQPLLRGMVTEKGLAEILEKKQKAMIDGKDFWSENAINNYKKIYGMANDVVRLTKGFLYEALDIKPVIL